MGSEFILLTSIPPRLDRRRHGLDVGSDYQRSCVESWIGAGFSVVSFNVKEEAETLRRSGLPISVEVIDSGVRPRIRDLLAFASDSGACMCGIVNADCMFVEAKNLAAKLAGHVDSTLLFSERIDIDPETDLPVVGNCGGFDAFFFDPASVADVADPFFRIGDTWWDYWLPFELAARGIALRRLETPFVLHLWHERAWSADDHLRNGNYFRTCVTRLEAEGRAPEELTEHLAEDDVVALAIDTYAWIRRNSAPVELLSADDAPMENLLRRLRESQATDRATQTRRVKSLDSQLRAVRDQLRKAEAQNQGLTTAQSKSRLDIDRIIESIEANERELGRETVSRPVSVIDRVPYRGTGGRARIGLFWSALLLVLLLLALTVLFLPQWLALWVLSGLVCLLLVLVIATRQVLRVARGRARQAQKAYGQLAKRVRRLREPSGGAEKR